MTISVKTLREDLMKKLYSFFAFIALVGCTSSGVMPMGPDLYSVSTTNEISPAYAKRAAIKEASEFCSEQGLTMMPVKSERGSFVDSFGDNISTFDYHFRCLREGDPDLGRAVIKE